MQNSHRMDYQRNDFHLKIFNVHRLETKILGRNKRYRFSEVERELILSLAFSVYTWRVFSTIAVARLHNSASSIVILVNSLASIVSSSDCCLIISWLSWSYLWESFVTHFVACSHNWKVFSVKTYTLAIVSRIRTTTLSWFFITTITTTISVDNSS